MLSNLEGAVCDLDELETLPFASKRTEVIVCYQEKTVGGVRGHYLAFLSICTITNTQNRVQLNYLRSEA